MRDWNLRAIFHRIWAEQRRGYKSWAIQLDPDAIEQAFLAEARRRHPQRPPRGLRHPSRARGGDARPRRVSVTATPRVQRSRTPYRRDPVQGTELLRRARRAVLLRQEAEISIIAANLLASRLTLLYGPAASVRLTAARGRRVAPADARGGESRDRRQAGLCRRRLPGGRHRWLGQTVTWRDDPLEALAAGIESAVADSVSMSRPARPLAALRRVARCLERPSRWRRPARPRPVRGVLPLPRRRGGRANALRGSCRARSTAARRRPTS